MNKTADYLGYYVLRTLSNFLKQLPPAVVVRMGRLLGEGVYRFSGKRASIAYADMKAVFGSQFSEKDLWKKIQRHYGYLGELFADLMCFPKMSRESMGEVIRVRHEERYLDTLRENKGVIVITGHFGNWELLQFVSNVYYGQPVHLIAAAQKHSRMNDFLNSLRSCQGSVVITRGQGMGVLKAYKAIKQNKVAGVLCDQDAGRAGGIIVPLLGRKTTIQTGPFELALKTGAPLFPCFLARTNGPEHELFMEHPIWVRSTEDPESEIKKGVMKFVEHLEGMIQRFPEQWLWGVKRWKYSWTKRLLILSNGNPEHLSEAEGVAERFREVQSQYGRPGMEYPVRTIPVLFKSDWHRRLFSLFAILFIPWAQGRLRWLGLFFKPETQRALEAASADFMISAEPGLAPLNLCLAKDSRAKSIFVTKPRFPFNLFRRDLVVSRAAEALPERLQEIL
jgi:KDO2-lipid IV(A) lauroyltransferase